MAGQTLVQALLGTFSGFSGYGAPGDEVLKRLLGKRPGMPLTVVTGLPLLGCVDAEQPHKLGAESHGIAIYDLKTRP